jgi:hypothetical protein
VTIKPLLFSTGKRHPLAVRQKFEVHVSGAAAHNLSNAVVIGDFLLYLVGTPMFNPTTNKDSICGIYLIAWKEGWVSEVRLYPTIFNPSSRRRPKPKMIFFSLLASHLRTGYLWPSLIRVVGGNNPVGSIARTGARAVPAIEHWRL